MRSSHLSSASAFPKTSKYVSSIIIIQLQQLFDTARVFLTVTTEIVSIMMSQPQCPEEIIDGDIMDTTLSTVVTMAMGLIT